MPPFIARWSRPSLDRPYGLLRLEDATMRLLDPELLRAFAAVADCRSFTRAAAQLGVTQPAISHQIKRLEGLVGKPLFVREPKKVELTTAGSHLLLYARRLVRLHEEALLHVAQVDAEEVLRIGMSDLFAERLLPDVLRLFGEEQPETRLDVFCDVSIVVKERMLAGELDIALTIRHDHEVFGENVGRERLVWAAAPGLDHQQNPVALVVYPEGCIYRRFALEALSECGRSWRIVYTSQNTLSTQAAVDMGLGVTVRTRRSVPERWRVLGPEDGFPCLPGPEVDLCRASASESRSCLRFYEVLRERLVTELEDGGVS